MLAASKAEMTSIPIHSNPDLLNDYCSLLSRNYHDVEGGRRTLIAVVDVTLSVNAGYSLHFQPVRLVGGHGHRSVCVLIALAFGCCLMMRSLQLSVELKLTDKVDAKTINVVEAENASPAFVKIVSRPHLLSVILLAKSASLLQSPNATLPALHADGKTYGNTIESVEYLAKVSDVKVAPATELTAKIHEDSLDPNFAFLAAVGPSLR